MRRERLIPEDPLGISYRSLRQAVGEIGIALPIMLVVGVSLLNGEFGIRESLSSYYWTTWIRNVACFCAVGSAMDDLSLPDLDARMQTLGGLKGRNGTGVIFLSAQCPTWETHPN